MASPCGRGLTNCVMKRCILGIMVVSISKHIFNSLTLHMKHQTVSLLMLRSMRTV